MKTSRTYLVTSNSGSTTVSATSAPEAIVVALVAEGHGACLDGRRVVTDAPEGWSYKAKSY